MIRPFLQKHLFLWALFLLMMSLVDSKSKAWTQDASHQEEKNIILRNMKTFLEESFPKEFRAKVQTSLLKERLDRIGIKNTEDVFVQIQYHQKWGGAFSVENVSPEYRGLFSDLDSIFDILNQIKTSSLKDIEQAYKIDYSYIEGRANLFLSPVEEIDKVLILKIDTEGKITQFQQILHSQRYLDFSIEYTPVENKSVPSKIEGKLYENQEEKSIQLNFEQIELNVGLKKKDFLG